MNSSYHQGPDKALEYYVYGYITVNDEIAWAYDKMDPAIRCGMAYLPSVAIFIEIGPAMQKWRAFKVSGHARNRTRQSAKVISPSVPFFFPAKWEPTTKSLLECAENF